MTLYKLLDGIAFESGAADTEIGAITCDSRQVERGSLFFCQKGVKLDGHDHAAKALEMGAAAVVAQRDLGIKNQIIVPDTREAWGYACANYFGNPAKKLKLMGVTGTNGKTSTTYIMKQILEAAGKKTGLIGTIQNEISDMIIPAKHTTPDPFQLHAMFSRMLAAGCEYVVMEVSSHALDQKRLAGCYFTAAVFTNLTQDHLDYHGTMESYYNAKRLLFDMCGTAVINLDDAYGKRLLEEISCPARTFSCGDDAAADFAAKNIRFTARQSSYVTFHNSILHKSIIPMPGMFNVSNALAATAACEAAGIPTEDITKSLPGCRGVPGRMEILETDTPYTVIREYAHSPDSLEKMLTAVKAFAPARVVVLFGCAGNRDRTKRPQMAGAAAKHADFCILTSDNPRDEDPQRIIDDALPGFKPYRTPHKVIADRYDAIRWALENSRPDDVLVLAGKGHEDYQVLDYGTIFFDEKVIVAELLAKIYGEK
ncbi:MAG: UDP-N-acetylmuramoyl-L-alanyl-D-glutamate--2,6-diaminopimelate ligase [Oscillospiraceae bacterium]|nr:UDP-N-acetylmuramoyl-L-alanyl-D-glutamate--2,6-diaminopimelate ligase [Oscillospiraceae bacterium]